MDVSGLNMLQYGLAATVALLSYQYLKQRFRRRGLSLPPGPPGYPLIGNVLELPRVREWETYAQWSKQYGEIVYVEAFGQPIVILGSLQAADEVFDKHGAVASDRPKSIMLKLCGLTWAFGLQRYGDFWRVRRRAFHLVNSPEDILEYQPGQLADTHMFLQNLINDPSDFADTTKWFIGAFTLRTVYGVKAKGRHDPILETAEELGVLTSEAVSPGRWMVEFLPWLSVLPSWTPGAAFSRFASHTRKVVANFRELPWEEMEAAQARGDGLPSMAMRMLDSMPEEANIRQIAIDSASSALLGGSDTSVGAVLNLIYAMAHNPEAQAKAQAELDEVVGRDRLPDFGDKGKLPYVSALLSEVFRWQVVSPVALPHMTSDDLEYKGFFIPKHTVLIPNVWAVLYDPEVFPEPGLFKPERWLRERADGTLEVNTDLPDPRALNFGFGRRVCPGQHIANNMLFASAVSLLATMNISRKIDAQGKPMPFNEEWTPGVLNMFVKFDCDIRPRDQHAINLVREAVDAGM